MTQYRITSLWRQNDATTSFWLQNDAVIALCVRWGLIITHGRRYCPKNRESGKMAKRQKRIGIRPYWRLCQQLRSSVPIGALLMPPEMVGWVEEQSSSYLNSHIREVADTVVSDLEELGRLILWSVEFRCQGTHARQQLLARHAFTQLLLGMSQKWCITVTSHERLGVSNHRYIDCLFNSLFG